MESRSTAKKTLLATSSYGNEILIWDIETGEMIRRLDGHNGAVYDLDFDPSGKLLVSASADDTLKVWQVNTGKRLDTLGQPLREQFVGRVSPNGKFIYGAGRDNRIRQWRLISKESAKINPLVNARFAHEQPIVDLDLSADSMLLASSSEDLSLKFWNARSLRLIGAYENQPAIATAINFAPDGKSIAVGRLDGSFELLKVRRNLAKSDADRPLAETVVIDAPVGEMKSITDTEPNNTAQTAQAISIPAKIKGKIFSSEKTSSDADVDCFQFEAKKGERFVLETNASRQKSPLDTKIAIVDSNGQPIPRVLLQAVRDSYFTFRGKDSNTSDDFRVKNWEEMELNEFLYADGEVVKLWHYPRGPDSGFRVYPGKGNRWTYFDTTPNSHALSAPCFIVEPYPPGTLLTPNGLPVFTIHYENDDESTRKLGSDSRLLFTAPADGKFVTRLTDVRGFEGENFHYELTIRRAQPDFSVRLSGTNLTVRPGSATEFTLQATRNDGFDGAIRVEISDLPPGFHATTPIVIEAGQMEAKGNIFADANAPKPTAENAKKSKVSAFASINGKERKVAVNSFGEFKLGPAPRVQIRLGAVADSWEDAKQYSIDKPLELTIEPGQMIAAKVYSERNKYENLIDFGKDDAGRGLPHGVYVDNIGLNGLMIRKGENERTFYISAAKWVPNQTRKFFLRANNVDGECAVPVILHVKGE